MADLAAEKIRYNNSLAWISSKDIGYIKHRSASVQVILYSSQLCPTCQQKLVPLFNELSAWPPSHWREHGYKAGVRLRFCAIDMNSNARPRESESHSVSRVPCIQMWAPAKLEYSPKIYHKSACHQLGYAALRANLVNWIVKHANGI